MTLFAVAPVLLLALFWHLPWRHTLPAEPHQRQLPGGVDPRSQILGDHTDEDPISSMGSRSEGRQGTWALPGPGTTVPGNTPGKGLHRKRAFKRAVQRANRDGGTWYKNQWMMSPLKEPPPDGTSWHPMMKSKGRNKPRLKVLSWNARILPVELWEEVQEYGQTHAFDVISLQSTGWTFSSTWKARGFQVVHSGTPEKFTDGIMMMISTKIAAPEHVSYSEIIPARILHVRIKQDKHSLDYVTVYQHPWRNNLTPAENLEKRKQIWDGLHECLSRLPFRNQVLVSGDFNASLISDSYPDNKNLKQLLTHHNLTTLMQSRSHQMTYYSPQGNTQIDYILGRRCQMDAQAKEGIVDTASPLGGWRETLDHRPLIATFPRSWMPWRRKPQNLQSAVQKRDTLIEMKRQRPEEWNQMCKQLSQAIDSLPPRIDKLEQIDKILTQQLQAPERPNMQPSGGTTGGLVKEMWKCHKQFYRSHRNDLETIWRRWLSSIRLLKLRKLVRTANRQRKRESLEQHIQEAANAFRCHNPYRMYKVIRKIAPKTPYQVVNLRSQYGLAQDPATELQEIAKFFQELCTGQEWIPSSHPLQQMPFTCEDIERALRSTPSTKSVAPDSCPGILVKHLSTHLAPWLYQMLSHAWQEQGILRIPPRWRDAWITCVRKRQIRTPRDIRPIALQCPIGKAILRALVRKAIEHVRPALQPYPIYAYLRGRSTEHALLRVHAHLRAIRDQCLAMNYNVWTRHAGHRQAHLRGGITLSLDLSNAFDTVDRKDIARGMELVRLPADMQRLFMMWLAEVTYHVQHKNQSAPIAVTRGIRQGCVASPFLWLMWSICFLKELEDLTSRAWIIRHLCIYADDIISQWNVCSYAEFVQSLQDIGMLLDLLAMLKLKVSLAKSAILMRIVGAGRGKILKKHCCRNADCLYMLIPRKDGSFTKLPIVRSHKYLGTVLTYINPEEMRLAYMWKAILLSASQNLRQEVQSTHQSQAETLATMHILFIHVWPVCHWAHDSRVHKACQMHHRGPSSHDRQVVLPDACQQLRSCRFVRNADAH